jgi:hypothetical protein
VIVRARGLIALSLTAWLFSSCGYSLAGRGSFLPESIRAIGIPLFVNNTPFVQIEQVLTEKVRAEFIGRGKYTVLPQDTGVDALLLGTIVNIGVNPASFTADQQASRYVIALTVAIQFRDVKADRVLWENPALVFSEEYEVTNATSALDPTAFFGQEANALDRVGSDFARTVVSAILEAF